MKITTKLELNNLQMVKLTEYFIDIGYYLINMEVSKENNHRKVTLFNDKFTICTIEYEGMALTLSGKVDEDFNLFIAKASTLHKEIMREI